MRPVFGIDFGTTNSVVTLLDETGAAEVVRRDADEVFRSVLCFRPDGTGGARHWAGPAAIEAYLDDPHDSRLIMSMKSYLAQRSFTQTRILSRMWTLEALIGLFLRELLAPVADRLADARVVVGRPVRFVGAQADDAFGEQRLRGAFALAGLGQVQVALEPAAAGARFAAGLDRPTTVLVADFGGGTSDFSVLRFTPGPPRAVQALGHAGVGIAGDALDYRIIDRVISPRLGKGSDYTVMGKTLPVPADWYAHFARWHRLSLMNTPRFRRDLADVMRTAEHPERLAMLSRLIEEEAGYALYRAVSDVKAALSGAASATLDFAFGGVRIEAEITRADFESWIAPELSRIATAVDAALTDAAIAPASVDRVFLTGGTSLVPAVRGLFERRFGADRIVAGGEFVSVAEGLALLGA